MTARRPRLFNIPADADFLPALVSAIGAGGFPKGSVRPPAAEQLPRWTILVPTRRAARSLGAAFLDGKASAARLLPKIRPIGDIDEDFIDMVSETAPGDHALEPAISVPGRKFLLLGLIEEWATGNPQEELARDLRQSPAHAMGLAASLARLLDKVETEGKDLFDLSALYDIDLAVHRQALVGLLGAVREYYPRRLLQLGLMDPTARRNALIRHQARLLADAAPEWPVIAAGSTGSIPATAELLRTIAGLELGAVILPGLDLEMDQASWQALTPQHAQYGLKRLLEFIGVDRGEVELLPGLASSGTGAARRWFAGEIMRPAATATAWRTTVSVHRERLATAIDGMTLCRARNRREESAAIAVILRQTLETSDETATLITPDRELARRVAMELRRWNIIADDSAGEPLIRSGPGRLVSLLIAAALNDFDAVSLAALLHHPLSHFGAGARVVAASRLLELVALRGPWASKGIGGLTRAVHRARDRASSADHVHMAIQRLNVTDWEAIEAAAIAVQSALGPLEALASDFERRPYTRHVEGLVAAIERVASSSAASGTAIWAGTAGGALTELFAAMLRDGHLHPPCRFAEAMLVVSEHLREAVVRPPIPRSARIFILGLLEARLLRSDVVILGSLNEGKWPAQPDPGPWVNRPMREVLGMQMPEREIGLTAHDFVQALGARKVYLTWSDRIEGAPAVPSRWVVTARMLIEAAGLDSKIPLQNDVSRWASQLDAPAKVAPIEKPKPTPPLEARPLRLSVTEIETLIRDPYAIYARKILRLEPLPELVSKTRYALQGTIIHDALDLYNKLMGAQDLSIENALIEAGNRIFRDYSDDSEIMNFWRPRYRRLAQWFAAEDTKLRARLVTSLTEQRGKIALPVAGETFTLTARADRIDIFDRGTARIVDYKTGSLPTQNAVEAGFKPQLTLEAAMLERNGFGLDRAITTDELLYVRLSGGEPPGQILELAQFDIMTVARKHLAELALLLTDYARPMQAYLPVLAMERERDRGDFDHLSRLDEWTLAGEVGR